MNADELSDLACSGGAGIGGGLHGSHVTSNDRGDEAGVDLLPPDEGDVGGLDHRIDGFDHADEPSRFNHSESFTGRGRLGCHTVETLPDSAASGDRQRLEYPTVIGEPELIRQVGHRAGMIGKHSNPIARPQW